MGPKCIGKKHGALCGTGKRFELLVSTLRLSFVMMDLRVRDMRVHVVWARVRGPFCMPMSICVHSMGWEVYDWHLAGCRQCGKQHCCDKGECPTERNNEGNLLCCITGMYMSGLNLSDGEVVESGGQFVSREDLCEAVRDRSTVNLGTVSIDDQV